MYILLQIRYFIFRTKIQAISISRYVMNRIFMKNYISNYIYNFLL